MFRSSAEERPLSPSERWISAAFIALILGLFALEVSLDFQPVKLTALLIVLFWVPLLILHEAGHAVAAVLLGWHVGRVVIGMGRRVGRFHVGGTQVEVRLLPLEGFVVPAPRDLHLPRLKSALIYFAGPGAELLLLALLVGLIGPAAMLSQADVWWLLAAQSLAAAILLGVFVNLVPHQVFRPEGPVANDGLGIIRSFLLPLSHYAERIGMRYEMEDDIEEEEEIESED